MVANSNSTRDQREERMGVGGNDLRLLIELKVRGYIPNGSSIIEIGAQQLADDFLACREELERVRQLFGVEQLCHLPPPLVGRPADGRLKPLDAGAPWARDFWSWLGLRYAAIDIDDSPGSIPLDLNFDKVPSRSKGTYQLVTNFGTTEHVANQLNAFKVIHDLTAPGGVMLHNVPAQGMFNHGLVNYNPKFFWMLARSNGYKFLHMDFSTSATVRPLSADITDYVAGFVPGFAERARSYGAADCGLVVAMQKVFDISYVAPLDVNTGTRTSNKALERRYWAVFDSDAFHKLEAGKSGGILRHLLRKSGILRHLLRKKIPHKDDGLPGQARQ
jgi:hypothetical protein